MTEESGLNGEANPGAYNCGWRLTSAGGLPLGFLANPCSARKAKMEPAALSEKDFCDCPRT